MKAKFTKTDVSNAVNMGQNKETVNTLTLVCFKKGTFHEPVVARFYMGRSASASVVYCSIWVHGETKAGYVSVSGRGNAGGYGYHKESAALGEAITNAGIELYGSAYNRRDEKENFKKRARIDGVGDSAMHNAILAIGRALGYTDKQMTVK